MITAIDITQRSQESNQAPDGRPRRPRGQPMRGLDILKKFVAEHGWERITRRTLADGFHLGHWVSVRRTDYKRGILADHLVRELESIPGWTWDPVACRYRQYLHLLRQYVDQRGIENFGARTIVNGVRLGPWATCRRIDYREGRLPRWLRHQLEEIPGWTWSAKEDFQRQALELTRRFVAANGWDRLRSRTVFEGVAIGAWATRRRADFRSGRLPEWLRHELETIPGWTWSHPRRREVMEVAT